MEKIFSDTEHVMAIQPYSMPFKGKIDLNELLKHIVYSKKNLMLMLIIAS